VLPRLGVMGWVAGTAVRCARRRHWASKPSDLALAVAAFLVSGLVYGMAFVFACTRPEDGWWTCNQPQPIFVAYAVATLVPILRAVLESESRTDFQGAKVTR